MSEENVQNSEPTFDEMIESTSEPATTEQATDPVETPKTDEERYLEYNALGATRREPESLVLKRASQGYDYAQKMADYKAQQEELQQLKADAEARHQKYAHLDEYAAQNPEWYDHWSQAYEQRQNQQSPDGQVPAIDMSPIKNDLDALKNEFSEVKDFVNKQRESQEDTKYWDEIQAVQKEFPDVDLNLADEAGKTLEYKILEHAKEQGIGSFRTAFRDFYHDKLKTRMYEQAKQDLLKADKENRKKGIVGVSNTPMLNSDMPDLRNMSENDILQAAIAEFNSME